MLNLATLPLSLALVSFSPLCFLTDSLSVGQALRLGHYVCVRGGGSVSATVTGREREHVQECVCV